MGQKPESNPNNPPRPAPPNWGRDALTKWLDQVRENQWGTFALQPNRWARFSAIDELFERMTRDWRDPSDILAAHLFIRCYTAYRTAVGHATAGMAVETHVMCRAMLEYASYALHIKDHPTRAKTLLSRTEPGGKRKVREEFTAGRVSQSVKSANEAMGVRYSKLYESAIDFGAHPNEGAVTGGMGIIAGKNGDRLMTQIMLHEPGPIFHYAVRRVMQTASCSLEIFGHVFPDRFAELGLDIAVVSQQIDL
jgi:hypothetical protein